MRILNTLKSEKGFTLIELVVVSIIIGILAAVALPNFTSRIEFTKEKRMLADLSTFNTIITIVYMEKNQYPDYNGNIGNVAEITKELTNVPKDPWNNEYQYAGNGDSFTVTSPKPGKSYLEDGRIEVR